MNITSSLLRASNVGGNTRGNLSSLPQRSDEGGQGGGLCHYQRKGGVLISNTRPHNHQGEFIVIKGKLC